MNVVLNLPQIFVPHPFALFLAYRCPQRLGVPSERSLLAGVKGQVFVAGEINGWETTNLNR